MKKMFLPLLLAAACGGSQSPETAPPPPAETTATGGAAYGGASYGGAVTAAAPDPACANAPKVSADDMEKQALAAMDGLLAAFESNQSDCKKVAAGITKWTGENREFVQRAKCFSDGATPEEQQRLNDAVREKNDELGGKIAPIGMKCQNDEDFLKAIQGMQELMQ